MQPWVWGRMRLYGVQGTQSVRADDEPETRPTIGEEGSPPSLRLTTTERRPKPRTSTESQPRIGFTGASKKFCPSGFFPVTSMTPVAPVCGRPSLPSCQGTLTPAIPELLFCAGLGCLFPEFFSRVASLNSFPKMSSEPGKRSREKEFN